MPIRLLTFTTLYPDSTRPAHGIFVETRLRHLLKTGEAVSRVVAPVPWFPSRAAVFGEYARYALVPRHEVRHGIRVEHPRYLQIPRFGMTLAPFAMAAAVAPVIRSIIEKGYDFDIIDAHYFYPDGVAAAMLGKRLKKPLVITARGTDINLIPRFYFPRRLIRRAAGEARALITVSQALKDALADLGVPGEKITVLRNGVDLALFKPPSDRSALRAELGLQGRTLLSVGHLIPRKGHDLAIGALALLPDTNLLIAGEGSEERRLRQLGHELGLQGRVAFLGMVSHDRLSSYYGAADALVLASSREGWVNVLLEAMACGTPVVATRIWGTPEVVAAPEAGVLVDERSPKALAEGVRRLFADYPDRAATRRYAERFSWDETSAGQLAIFRRIVSAE